MNEETAKYTEFQLIWDLIFIVIVAFCMTALFLVYPESAYAAGNDSEGPPSVSLLLVGVQASASDAQAAYAPAFKRSLTAGSVGTTLGQPVQPNTAGIHGAATLIRIGF